MPANVDEKRVKNNSLKLFRLRHRKSFSLNCAFCFATFAQALGIHCSMTYTTMNILVVDDESPYVALISDILAMHKYRVVGAYNGAEALSVLESTRVDAIVSDIEMPIMNGIALHQALLNDPSNRDTHFIFLTASENPVHRDYAAKYPSVGFIPKNEILQKLIPMLAELAPVKR